MARELGDRLNRADLVVGVHHRDERRVVGDRLAQRDRATTMPVWSTGSSVVRQPRRASALSVLSTASCSMALAMRCRRPVGSSASAAPRIAKLSRLGAAAREDDLGRIGADERGDRRPRLVERRLGLLAEVMHARRVAEQSRGSRAPSASIDLGRERGRRVVVEVDTHGESFIVAFPLTLSNKRTRQRFGGSLYWLRLRDPTAQHGRHPNAPSTTTGGGLHVETR